MASALPTFLAIDAGTGGGKCMIVDARGQRLAVHRQPWSYHVTTNPDIPYVKEFQFDADEFWGVLCTCVKAAARDAGVQARDIAGIAATSQREGCLFLNAAGTVVYAGPNLDARGFVEGLEILEQLGVERLHEITGHSAPFIFPIARYLWYRKHHTDAAARLLMINDWLIYRLTDELCAEPSNATESMLFDFRARSWSTEILDLFSIPADILPPIHASGTRIGALTDAAAGAMGLRPGIPVFIGGADTQCSLLGAGVIAAGEAGATLGTTTPVQMVVDQPLLDPQHNLWSGCHVVPDRWVVESNAGDTGDAYLWLLNLLGGDREVERLFQYGEELAQGDIAPQVFSFIGPSIFNMAKASPMKPGGILFPFPLLHHRPERGDLVRSFLDSIGYAIRANCEQIAVVTGALPRSLTLSGGLARSDALVQRVANVLGLPVLVAQEAESAALGCAVLSAVGLGVFDSLAAAVKVMVRVNEVQPDPAAHERYQVHYLRWREIYDKLDDISVLV